MFSGRFFLARSCVAFGPDVRLGQAVDELDSHAYTVGRFADAAFDHVVDAEFLGDAARRHRLAFVDEDGVARDDEQVLEACDFGDDVFGQSVGEEFLVRVSAHVDERQHRDRRHARRGLLSVGRAGRSTLLVEPHAKDVDRPVDVLHIVLAEVLEHDVEPVADLIADRGGDVDASRLCDRLEPCRDVHAVAEYVVLFDDDVAEVDADAVVQRRLRSILLAPRHGALEFGRAADRVGHALEFDQHPVARGLDHAATALLQRRIDELEPDGLEERERAGLVPLHESAVADHVRRQYGREPALDVGLIHASSSSLERFYQLGAPTESDTISYDGAAGCVFGHLGRKLTV
jgi:hypothetical protein